MYCLPAKSVPPVIKRIKLIGSGIIGGGGGGGGGGAMALLTLDPLIQFIEWDPNCILTCVLKDTSSPDIHNVISK